MARISRSRLLRSALAAVSVALLTSSVAQPAAGRRDKTVSIWLTEGGEQKGPGQRYATIRYCPPPSLALPDQCNSGREGRHTIKATADPGSALAWCKRYMRGRQAPVSLRRVSNRRFVWNFRFESERPDELPPWKKVECGVKP